MVAWYTYTHLISFAISSRTSGKLKNVRTVGSTVLSGRIFVGGLGEGGHIYITCLHALVVRCWSSGVVRRSYRMKISSCLSFHFQLKFWISYVLFCLNKGAMKYLIIFIKYWSRGHCSTPLGWFMVRSIKWVPGWLIVNYS